VLLQLLLLKYLLLGHAAAVGGAARSHVAPLRVLDAWVSHLSRLVVRTMLTHLAARHILMGVLGCLGCVHLVDCVLRRHGPVVPLVLVPVC